MDGEAFDRLSRSLALPSRRGVLLAALGGAWSALAPAVPSAAKKKPKPKVCANAGAPCSKKVKCCRGAGDCLELRCVCPDGQKRCGDICIPRVGCCGAADCDSRGHSDPCSVLRCRNHDCLPEPFDLGTVCGPHGEGTCQPTGCQPRTCSTNDDCHVIVTDPECAWTVCQDGQCVVKPRTFGIELAPPRQVAGDCQRDVCNGTGGVTTRKDDEDLPPDRGPCFLRGCDAGTPLSDPRPPGYPCPGGHCDGTGVCKPG